MDSVLVNICGSRHPLNTGHEAAGEHHASLLALARSCPCSTLLIPQPLLEMSSPYPHQACTRIVPALTGEECCVP